MTLDEAIAHCEEVADYDCYNENQMKCANEHRQLAEWLRDYKELKIQLSGKDATSDLISRKAAIDEIKEIYEWHDKVTKERVIEHFERLPSAQPKTEERTAESSQKVSKEDLISRKTAIDAIMENVVGPEDLYNEGLRVAAKIMLDLPSAQPVITCDGCRFVSTYDTDFPCCSCVRREKDYYEPER